MQVCIIVQASDPKTLKTKIDQLIAAGKTIQFIVETTKSFYMVIHSA